MSTLSFDPTLGPARERIDREELDSLERVGALVRDERRTRSLYFDGRFLAARDLVRDQAYTLQRLADVGRAFGGGIVAGLEVTWQAGTSRLTIAPGHGLTPAGEQVVLRPESSPESGPGGGLVVNLFDLPRLQTLNLALKLSRLPQPPARSLHGTFLLVLRPVEFTANPIAAYPTSIAGERSVLDGDIVEATAVALVPYPSASPGQELRGDAGRAQLAREVFHLGAEQRIPAQVLPLAALELAAGRVLWLDVHLARRDVGRDSGDLLSFGAGERALRSAWLRQYAEQLGGIEFEPNTPAAAADWFAALPPAGPLPKQALDPKTFTQTWFPAAVDTEIAIVPEDELPALVEEALILPGLDLRAAPEELESSAVLVLLPVERRRIGALRAKLAAGERAAGVAGEDAAHLPAWDPGRRVALSRFEGRLSIRAPLDRVRALAQPRSAAATYRTVPTLAAPPSVELLWSRELAGAGALWYVRRRNVERRLELLGAELRLAGTDFDAEAAVLSAATDAGVKTAFEDLTKKLSLRAKGQLYAGIFKNEGLLKSPLLLRGLVRGLEEMRDAGGPEAKLERHQVLEQFTEVDRPGVGDGLTRLEQLSEDLRKRTFTRADLPLEDALHLDALARGLDAERAAALADTIAEKVLPGDGEGQAERLRGVLLEFDAGRDVVGRLRTLGVEVREGTLSAEEDERRHVLGVLGTALERSSSLILGNYVAEAVARPVEAADPEGTRAERIHAVETELGADEQLGRGLEEVERADPVFRAPAAVALLARSEIAPELDRLVRELPPERSATFLADLRTVVARDARPESVTALIARTRGIPR